MKRIIIVLLVISLIAGCIQGSTYQQQATEGETTQQPSTPGLPWQSQIVCGNNKCETGETKENCCQDCGCDSGLYCTDNLCKPKCGDNICAGGENQDICCVDCGCATGFVCENSKCVELKPNVKMGSFVGPTYNSVTYLRAVGGKFSICIVNDGNDNAKDIKITFTSPNNYFATSSTTISSLAKGESKCVDVSNVDFLDISLDIVSETSLHTDIKIEYYNSVNKKYETTESSTFKAQGRNYFINWWDYPEMVSSWVTPSQKSVREFASKATGGLATYATSTAQMMAARWIFESMRAYGVKYVTDAHVSGDYVQFPIETLQGKGGDCEDNAILFASLIESVGMESVVILIPGHAFSGYINKEGQLVPIETTASNFDSALSSGLYGYNQHASDREVTYPSKNWYKYPQVILPETTQLAMPAITKQIGSCTVNWNLQLGFYVSTPVKFTNSGNAPGAGCAAVAVYDANRNKIDDDLSCWTVNPGETKQSEYIVDITISNWLEGYYCSAY
jgi:hypothetical protein